MKLVISPSLLVFSLILVFSISCQGGATAAEPYLLKGKVTDVEGKPVEDAVIFIYQSTNTKKQPDFASPKSDREGRFRIALPPGKYWAVARVRKDEEVGPVPSRGRHSGEPAEIEMRGEGDVEKDFVVADIREIARMGAKTRREAVVMVAGRILDGDGKPVRMAYALAKKGGDLSEVPDYLSGWTDETGYYALYLPRGKYHLGAAASFPSDEGNLSFTEVIIDGDKKDIDIIMNTPFHNSQ
ncbi:exported hypothetical protein [Candidatus Sulfobium mesophilum]|uniref:Carboxypeptidase regulatory-like domain-containing protein n=1 Tax=Candidatus Sulfobium mesophilum TaxID=2016548 RepID=A0A2U3QEN4_9BACT|nr:exported hypothetical protein [Candidatus Sulfobium mesophilum]